MTLKEKSVWEIILQVRYYGRVRVSTYRAGKDNYRVHLVLKCEEGNNGGKEDMAGNEG